MAADVGLFVGPALVPPLHEMHELVQQDRAVAGVFGEIEALIEHDDVAVVIRAEAEDGARMVANHGLQLIMGEGS